MMKRIFHIFLFIMLTQISFLTRDAHPQFSGEAIGIEGFLSFKDGRRLSWKGESSHSLFHTEMTYLTKPLIKLYVPHRKSPVQISAAKMTIGHRDRVIILREKVVIQDGSRQLKTSFVKLNPETFFMTSYADYSIRDAQKVSQGRGFYGSLSRLFLLKIKEKRSPANDQDRIQKWIDLLSDRNAHISSRCSVAEMLAESDDSRVIQPLVDALNEGDPTLVAIAARGLGRMKATAAIQPLINYLAYLHVSYKGFIFARERRDNLDFSKDYVTDNPDLHAALSIAWALGRIGTRATEALIGYLDAPGEDLKTGAAWAIGRISSPLNLILLLYPRAQAKEIEEAIFETPNLGLAIPRLRKLVQSDEAEPLKATAARALGRIKDKEAIPALFEAMKKSFDADEDLRTNIIWALGEIGNEEAISLLCEFLKRTDDEINLSYDLISFKHISNALIKIGLPSVPFLLKVLSEPEFDKYSEDRKLRLDEQISKKDGAKAAIEALGEIRDRRAIDTLSNVALYNPWGRMWDLHEWALRALLHYDDLPLRSLRIVMGLSQGNEDILERFLSPIYVKKMIEILQTPNEERIRLKKLYEDKVENGDKEKLYQFLQIEQKLDFDSELFAAQIIRDLGPLADNAADALIAVVKSESSEQRRVGAIHALSAIGNPKALPALIEALKDNENWVVRKSAFEALRWLMPKFKEAKERLLPTPDDKISSLHAFEMSLEDQYVEGLLSFLNDYQTRIDYGFSLDIVTNILQANILQEFARIKKTQALPFLFNFWLKTTEQFRRGLPIHGKANFNDRFVEILVMIGEDSLEYLLNQIVCARQHDTDRVSHLIGLFQKLWIHFPERFLLAVQKEPLSEFEGWLLHIIYESGKTAVAPLLEVLVKESAPEAKVLAINILRELREKAAILPIAMLLTDQHEAIRQAAKDYFLNVAFNDTEIRYLLHLMIYSTEEKERDAATKVFMELKDSRGALKLIEDILESRLKHSTERGKKALEPILEALKERK